VAHSYFWFQRSGHCPSSLYAAGIKSQNQKESRWTISPKRKRYRIVKDWAIENKRMKLAVLAAWINMGWKLSEKFFVNYPADKRRVQSSGSPSTAMRRSPQPVDYSRRALDGNNSSDPGTRRNARHLR
jgi:hypothetical protein